MRWISRAVLVLVALAVALSVISWWTIERQVPPATGLARGGGAEVVLDARGIPTIEAGTWPEVLEAQGYVVASERMFHMDLMRRSGAGRLSEWFGDRALELDRRRKLEEWEETADRAYAALPPDEREVIDAYTRGVNRYIGENRGGHGVEYVLLRTEPEPWQGRDSLLILLSMCEQLSASALQDLASGTWLEHAGPEWWGFLYTQDHPWNQPMFGEKEHERPELPLQKALPLRPIDADDARVLAGALAQAEVAPVEEHPEGIGSNNWAWCGKTGCFVANDPHLGASVPALWYANRLRVKSGEWVVGVSIPGLPGVTLGMNQHLAWAFTNVGEDVDDLLVESLSPDGKLYLAAKVGGQELWRPIREERKVIRSKDGAGEEVVARFTHRGPLYERNGRWYSRAWLPLREGRLRFPAAINRASSWEEMNAALDQMVAPAQNVLVADRKGNIGYRASGTGILRRRTGRVPQPALEGEWLGFAPASSRPRTSFYRVGEGDDPRSGGPRFLATANERIWVDPFGHSWADEQRKERIRRALASRDDLTREDMEALQRDTESRYRKLLLDWARAHADPASAARAAAAMLAAGASGGGPGEGGARVPGAADAERVAARWGAWSGVATDDPQTFTDAIAADNALSALCIERARALLPASARAVGYDAWNRTAWIITMLETPEGGTRVFGLEEGDLASHLLALAVTREARAAPPYHEQNRWAAQHPFAKVVPVLGELFLVGDHPQPGWRGVLRVEQPAYGASVRLVWDALDPAKSTWSLPVGQSGHIGSPHYRDLQPDWAAGRPAPVFDASWRF